MINKRCEACGGFINSLNSTKRVTLIYKDRLKKVKELALSLKVAG